MFRTATALLASILAAATIARAADSPAPASRPNIILILSDDVGLGDIHCCGGPFKTPNIDKLATGGTRFENCYSTPLCGPSRCQLLTGRYPFRTGLNSNQNHPYLPRSRGVQSQHCQQRAGGAARLVDADSWDWNLIDPPRGAEQRQAEHRHQRHNHRA